jgi:hypothetical protein
MMENVVQTVLKQQIRISVVRVVMLERLVVISIVNIGNQMPDYNVAKNLANWWWNE